MEKGKTAKYFKYAIGEIVLVVIGILIALQINNWNEDRKLRKQEINYYCQLVDNLNSDLSNIRLSQNSLDVRLEAAQRFLINLLKKHHKKDLLIQDWLGVLRSRSFVPTRAAIEDITSSGKLEIIGNENHKNAILDYYVQQDQALDIMKTNKNQLFDLVFEIKGFTAFGIHEVPEYSEIYSNELQKLLKSSDWQKNPNDPIYQGALDLANMSIILCAREKEVLNDIQNQAEELIGLLEGKCQNHKN
ncbi:DUF6090 family protein [Winogradskyella alexanderae]|uniref:PilJ/NarX-like methyl-accepting chemotaxis transducer n=1 Tax=Winogradskyella alexanderae TaxID=2877123 RepID=A0ABS7XT82_9FLAO|nr:DUF6090 family protein [Winogradskyella alexanderae]MCA0133232.1 hypothetical protein [Winogradskyella alexanderae]